jgi:hypothetical protein
MSGGNGFTIPDQVTMMQLKFALLGNDAVSSGQFVSSDGETAW